MAVVKRGRSKKLPVGVIVLGLAAAVFLAGPLSAADVAECLPPDSAPWRLNRMMFIARPQPRFIKRADSYYTYRPMPAPDVDFYFKYLGWLEKCTSTSGDGPPFLAGGPSLADWGSKHLPLGRVTPHVFRDGSLATTIEPADPYGGRNADRIWVMVRVGDGTEGAMLLSDFNALRAEK